MAQGAALREGMRPLLLGSLRLRLQQGLVRRHRGSAHACLVAVGQFVACLAVLRLTHQDGSPALLWPGSAILLMVLLHQPRPAWSRLVLASTGGILLGALAIGVPPLDATLLTCLGQAEALVAALVLRDRVGHRVNLARLRDLGRFAALVALAPAASGVPVALYLHLAYGAPAAGSLATWWVAHALGLALLVPLLLAGLAAGRANRRRLVRPGMASLLAFLAALALLAAVSLLVFLGLGPAMLYLLFPPMLLVTWRHGTVGAAAGVALVAVVVVVLTFMLGSVRPLANDLRELQLFLLVLSATTLPVAALLATHQRLRGALRRGAAEHRRQALLLESVLAAMEQGLAAYCSQGRLLAANGRYTELLGLPPDLVVPGCRYLDVARHLAKRGELGPGDPEELAQQRLRVSSAGRHHRLNRVQANGRGVEVTGRPLPGGGWVTTIGDVTEAMQRERRLAESEASFRLLTENSGDVVARMGLDGRFRYVSPAALRVLGRSPAALGGHALLDFVAEEDRAWVTSSQAALVNGEVTEIALSFRFLRADDSEAWVEARVRLEYDANDEPQDFVLTLRDATDRKAAEAELLAAFEQMEAMAQTDGLTGLANRRHFDETLNREWRRATREGTSLALLLIDADRFKLYNDRYGHAAGDHCLQQVAAAVAGAARRPGDLAARYGGEEFVLLLPNTDLPGAMAVAERLRQDVLAMELEHLGNPPVGVVSISLGAACGAPLPDTAVETDALLRAADVALYAAKTSGRNRVVAHGQAQEETLDAA